MEVDKDVGPQSKVYDIKETLIPKIFNIHNVTFIYPSTQFNSV